MRRLTLSQILAAIAIGALFAALQGEAPVPALESLASVACAARAGHC